MKFIRIHLPIEPTSQSRPRVVIKDGKTWSYYPPATIQGRDEFTECIQPHARKIFPEHLPLRLTISFYRQRSRWVGKIEDMPVRKPDINNFLSLALDCMTSILYPDDAQITKVIMKKRWADGGNWRTPGYIELELVEDKLTRSEKIDRDKWNANKLKIAQWEKKEKNKQEALDRKYHRNKVKTEV
jgi:Holliday junction resolvase RusA-like endonuclease